MNGLFGAEPIDQLATWVAALATLVVLGGMLGERRLFAWSQHLLAGLATGYLALLAITEVIVPRLVEPLAADPGGRPELVVGLGLVAVTAATPWLPRIFGAVPLSIAIGALAAFALGGAIVGTLLPQLAAAVARTEPSLVATAVSAAAAVVTGLVVVGFLHGSPRGRIFGAAATGGRWLHACGNRWLARLSPPLAPGPPDRPPRLPARRLARAAVMTASVSTELALLVDVGSAWAKAGVVGRARGRWRIVAHAAQPTSWGAPELRRQLVEQLEASGDPRLAGRYEGLLSTANRIECHTARQVGRLAVIAVSRELSGGAARRAAEAAGWEVADVVTLDDGRSLAERLALLQAIEVDAWLLAGGFDDASSPRALEAAGLVAAARPVDGGAVVWAGSARLADQVAALFEPGSVTAVGNARPTPHREEGGELREHLQRLLRNTVAQEDQAHLSAATLPRAVSAIAAAGALRVLAVDLGARGAIRALAEPDGSVASRLHSSGGLAGIARVAGAAGRVARQAPDAGDEAAVADLLQTMRARPETLPQTAEEVAGLQAAARILLAAMFDDDPVGPVDLLIGAGRTIAGAPRPAQTARMLLDGVRPIGVTQLAVDSASILGPLGSLPDGELTEGLELLADDA